MSIRHYDNSRIDVAYIRDRVSVMRRKMKETQYRASRFCRIMGNPTAYQIVQYLARKKSASPTELVEEIGLSLQTICDTLRNLRNVDVVRYETADKRKVYFLKEAGMVRILEGIEGFVQRARFKEW
jgi:DNA-binding transcriptional ArsR family regulator